MADLNKCFIFEIKDNSYVSIKNITFERNTMIKADFGPFSYLNPKL